jgi:hypothetical protein
MNRLTSEQRAEALRLHRGGMTLQGIMDRFNCSYESARRAVDPAWARQRQEQVNEARRRRALGKEPAPGKGGRLYARAETTKTGRVSPEDIQARLREVPSDTRSLTAVLLGDPLPGRSALDRGAS